MNEGKEVLNIDSSWEAIRQSTFPVSEHIANIEILFRSPDNDVKVTFTDAYPIDGMVELIDIDNIVVIETIKNGVSVFEVEFSGDENHKLKCASVNVAKT